MRCNRFLFGSPGVRSFVPRVPLARILFVVTTLVSVIGIDGAARATEIAVDGKAKCIIVTADDATPAEQTAALQLAIYLNRATGATFERRSEKDSDPAAAQI